MLRLLTRGMGRCGAVAACLQIVSCSLQNFDSLSSGDGSAGRGGSAGHGPDDGSGGHAGDAPLGGGGGSGGTRAPRAGAGGQSGGSGGTSNPSGGAAGTPSSGGDGSGVSGSGGSGGSAGSTVQLVDGGTRLNLLPDPSFTLGHAGWQQFGNAALADAAGAGPDGSQCLAVSERAQTYAGPSIDLQTLVVAGQTYGVEAWVHTSSLATQSVSVSTKLTCTGESAVYTPLVTQLVPAGEWLLLSGELTAPTCALDAYLLYIEGPEVDVDLYVDDVALFSAP